MDAVGAVIVHFHREREAAELVANLVEVQRVVGDNIVLVDNGSSEGLLDAELLRVGLHPTVLALPNVGFAGAVNVGCQALPEGVRYLLIFSHEVVLEAGCVMELVRQLQGAPRALVGPVLTLDGSTVWSAGGMLTPLRALPRHQLQGVQVSAVRDGVVSCDWLDGAAIATSRDFLEEIGGLDEQYFLYMEDVDLGMRAREHSGRVLVVPSAHARQSPGPGIDPYIWTRNMFLLFRTHGRRLAWALWLCSCLAGMLRDTLSPSRRRTVARRLQALKDGVRGRDGRPPGYSGH